MSRLPILSQPEVAPLPLPTVAALDTLWREVSQRPLWAPPHFWRYVALRWRMRLDLLDAASMPIAAPEGKVNDCAECLDMCCVGPRSTVLLGLRDIATLVDVGRTELITTRKPKFAPEELAARPALRRLVSSRSWQRFPVLAQNSFGACRALSNDGKCTLYPHWPVACARFPYALHLDDREIFYSSRCQSFWIHPNGAARATAMKVAAVAAYNSRIVDAVLLAYAPDRLATLGLLGYLS